LSLKSEFNYRFKWFALVFKWLWQPYQIYLFLAVPILLLFVLNIFHLDLSLNFVITGTFLQILGVYLAIHGLIKIRKSFGKDGVHDIAKKWFKRFPKYKEGVNLSMTAVESGSDSTSISISIPFKSIGTLEQRLDIIDKRIDDDMKNYLKFKSEVESDKSNKEREIKILKKSNAVEIDNVRKEIGTVNNSV